MMVWWLKYLKMDEADGDGGDLGGGGEDDTGAADGDDTGGEGDSGTVSYFNTVPEDWRTQALKTAGIDENSEDYAKRLKQLERVSDTGVLFKNYFNAQDRIRNGEISNGLPENPSEEQIAAWREAQGVPATPDAYELALDEGLVLSEADEKALEGVFEVAHANNVPAAAVSAMTNAMLASRQAEAEAIMAKDGVDTQMTTKMLKETWGGDFEMNTNMVKGMLNSLPETIRDDFMSARLANGQAVFNSPEIMVAMADWARTINPAATVVPNSNNPMQTINDEIKTLEARMGTSEWFKDKDAQKRYLDLIDAQAKLSAA